MKKAIFYDGNKKTSFAGIPDEAWETVTGKKTDQSGLSELRKRVPWLYRGIQYRANGVARVPFRIINKQGDVIDSSEDYQNEVGFLPDPSRYFQLIEMSVALFGKAYSFNALNFADVTREMRYLNPHSIEPQFDMRDGLVGYDRRLEGDVFNFESEDIVNYWLPDPEVEVGPPMWSPATAALAAADVLLSVDEFTATFFKRGAIKPTVLGVPVGTPESEKKKLEGWFNRLMSGIANAFRTRAINMDNVDITTIGDGIQDIENDTLTDSRRQDIAAALGVPETKMFQAANRATKERDDKGFYEDTIIPDLDFIDEQLNKQVMRPNGYHIIHAPQEMSIFQEDEALRSEAYANYTGSGMYPSVAIQVLGIDIPEEVDTDELDEQYENFLSSRGRQGIMRSTNGKLNKEDEVEKFKRYMSKRDVSAMNDFEFNYLDEKEQWALKAEYVDADPLVQKAVDMIDGLREGA